MHMFTLHFVLNFESMITIDQKAVALCSACAKYFASCTMIVRAL